MKAQRIVVKPGQQDETRMRNNSRGPILLTQHGQSEEDLDPFFSTAMTVPDDWFSPPKPAPVVIIRNAFGEQIDIAWKVLEIFGIKTSEADSGSTLIFLASRYSGPSVTG